jgi:hypothetical protein
MTDPEAMDFLISIAEISGVFVAFGVLIGAVQNREAVAPEKKALAQAVSMIGIVSLLGALVPPILQTFGLSGRSLWFYSTIGFEAIILFGFSAALSQKDFREYGPVNRKRWPIFSLVYWFPLEISLQGALLLIIFGALPEKGNALYLFAQWVNLAEAGIALTLLVFHNERDNSQGSH